MLGIVSYSGTENFYYSWDLGWMHALDTDDGCYFYLYSEPQLGYLFSKDHYEGWIWCFGKACWMKYMIGSGAWVYGS